MAENVPIMLGQYKLGKTLGIGAFGKVKCTFIAQTWTCSNDYTALTLIY